MGNKLHDKNAKRNGLLGGTFARASFLSRIRSSVVATRKPIEPSSLNNHDFQNQRTKPGCRSEGKANTKATSLMHPAKFFMAAAEYDPFG